MKTVLLLVSLLQALPFVQSIRKILEEKQLYKVHGLQVADLSGFTSYSSFLRSFRQYTGKTPSEYLSAGQEP